MASARRSQLFPKIKSSSFESRTCTEVGNFKLFIMIGRSLVIPKDRVRSPFAVTTINRDGRSMEYPNRLSRGIVIILVAAHCQQWLGRPGFQPEGYTWLRLLPHHRC